MTSRILQLGILILVVTGVGITYYAFTKIRQSVSQTPAPAMPVSEPATSFSFPVHAVPKSLPALAFVDGDRQKRTLASFKGKLVLLNIWATWCTPCREEMPTLDRLQAKLGTDQFEVIALSIDRAEVSLIEKFYADGYYLYRDKFQFAMTKAVDQPMLGAAHLPAGQSKNDPSFGQVEVFYHFVQAVIPWHWDASNTSYITLDIEYQGCADQGLCYPPVSTALIIERPVSHQ